MFYGMSCKLVGKYRFVPCFGWNGIFVFIFWPIVLMLSNAILVFV
jgi:hypothetical protein